MASSVSFRTHSRLAIGVLSILAGGCGGGTAPAAACRQIENPGTRIGASGGTLRLDGDNVVLVIPAGAVAGPCGIVVAIEPWTDVSTVAWSGARALIGTSYRVRAYDLSDQPEKVRLAVPATLTLRFASASVPPGASAEELVIGQVTRVACSPDWFGYGCSWDLAYRALSTSRVDLPNSRLTAAISCLDVCGGNAEGFGDGTGEFLVMHPRCDRYGGDLINPLWHCERRD